MSLTTIWYTQSFLQLIQPHHNIEKVLTGLWLKLPHILVLLVDNESQIREHALDILHEFSKQRMWLSLLEAFLDLESTAKHVEILKKAILCAICMLQKSNPGILPDVEVAVHNFFEHHM